MTRHGAGGTKLANNSAAALVSVARICVRAGACPIWVRINLGVVRLQQHHALAAASALSRHPLTGRARWQQQQHLVMHLPHLRRRSSAARRQHSIQLGLIACLLIRHGVHALLLGWMCPRSRSSAGSQPGGQQACIQDLTGCGLGGLWQGGVWFRGLCVLYQYRCGCGVYDCRSLLVLGCKLVCRSRMQARAEDDWLAGCVHV